MKLVTIMLSALIIFSIAGCKNKSTQPSSEKVSKELVDSFKKLDQETIDITIRNRWLAERLDAALAELERCHGLETPVFDFGKASGGIPDSSKPGFKRKEPEFYAPYPILSKSNLPTRYEAYVHSESLTAHINMQMRIREPIHFGTDKYVEYLEQRMKRLEEHLDKKTISNTTQE
ncbi:MAG: hypothetical protein MUP16_05490 [Sedimentisphaerales bacterium]|nr:hypothetical protein [Sedimentisphaerales bacterium]